jgi:TolB protein
MNADGTNLKRLTENSTQDHYASWSPDGEKIIFISDRSGTDEIFIMNKDGSKLQKIQIRE